MKQNQKGFSALVILLIIVVLGTIAGIGYKLVKADVGQAQTQTNISSTETKGAKQSDEKTAAKVELKEYKNTEFGFTFQYPSTWKYDADFSYAERGANEGQLSVTSPSGAVITFKANLGGKGGGCGDTNPNDTPHHTALCSTREILKITQIQPAGSKEYPVNLYQYKYTGPGENAKSEFGMYVDSGQYAPTTTGSTIGAIFPFSIMQNTKGNIESHTSGGDRTSSEYFSTQQAKDTELVLKTFKLL
jgi:hypothetical protein